MNGGLKLSLELASWMAVDEARSLGKMYRAVSSDLLWVRARSGSADVSAYLNDLVGRPDAWQSRLRAKESRIQLNRVQIQVFDFGQQFRLVGRHQFRVGFVTCQACIVHQLSAEAVFSGQ